MKQPSRFKLAVLVAAAATTLTIAGCGAKEPLDSGNTGSTPPPSSTSPSPQAAEGAGEGTSANGGKQSGSSLIKQKIVIYQTDAELTELKELKTEISFPKEEKKLQAALEALAGDDRDGALSLWQGVKLNSVSVVDGAAKVDITIPADSRLGGPGEQLALDAMAKTVFQFKDIQSLDLLVDGEAVDSLMGHVELPHPIKRSDYDAAK
ncbi:GerMN domain-containing protein [Paenibacillus pasadenensis]|uniref:GerMN domain-containing protein n=1 Tax=Paenibacillus pasadenensis TaxID=217090 RepID=UPI00203E072A|nr:GerMN domain-containing protein [Paenibacillus pasadenensis]MCM3747550.1 GerMN domain-containing protein [Paenibacillus pasadenensis]